MPTCLCSSKESRRPRRDLSPALHTVRAGVTHYLRGNRYEARRYALFTDSMIAARHSAANRMMAADCIDPILGNRFTHRCTPERNGCTDRRGARSTVL